MCYGTILWDRVQKARKLHRCEECARDIAPGQPYRTQGGRDGRELIAMKYCIKCATRLAITDNDDTDGDGCVVGDLKTIAKEHAARNGWKRFLGVMRAAKKRLLGVEAGK